MGSMATLYIRNVPAELYDRLKRRAEGAGRSVNAEILEVLARDDADRRKSDEFHRLLAEMKATYPPIESHAVDLIREDRDRGHKPELGY
jgi:plasmid stability protein